MKNLMVFVLSLVVFQIKAQDVTGTWQLASGYKVEWFQNGDKVYAIHAGNGFKHFIDGRINGNRITAQQIRVNLNDNCRTMMTLNGTVNGNSMSISWRANDGNCDLRQGQTGTDALTRTTARPMGEITGSAFNPNNDLTGAWNDAADYIQDGNNVYYIYNNPNFKHFFKGTRNGNQITGIQTRVNRSNNCRTDMGMTFTISSTHTMQGKQVANDSRCDLKKGWSENFTLTRRGEQNNNDNNNDNSDNNNWNIDFGGLATAQLENIEEWLCPNALIRGDREFDGHGPKIKCEAKLRIGDDGTELFADIYLWAQETQHDWSTTERRWSKKVYDAPNGKRIESISSSNFSKTQFISPPGGFQFLVPGSDVASTVRRFVDVAGPISNLVLASYGLPPNDYAGFARLISGYADSGNTVVKMPSVEGTLVKFFHIVGDTGGADISDDDNCNDDTRIVKIEFNEAIIKLK